MALVHHHFLYKARGINRTDLSADTPEARAAMTAFMYDLLKSIDMQELIPPHFAFSKFRAWTGIMGIITSHIAFHYWTEERALQLDIYSCKPFSPEDAKRAVRAFWAPSEDEALFLERDFDAPFSR